jgi:hypothetical protein
MYVTRRIPRRIAVRILRQIAVGITPGTMYETTFPVASLTTVYSILSTVWGVIPQAGVSFSQHQA